MFIPSVYREEDRDTLHQIITDARLGNFITATAEGPLSTPLPLYLVPDEGEWGTLYGHMARVNPQWRTPAVGNALAIFMGPDAYVSPSWYPTKQQTHKVVPTWNYVAVHAFGPMEVFEESDRLMDVITRLTNLHEKERPDPWAVSDAPDDYIRGLLKGIVGIRLPITELQGKRKMSQDKSAQDRAGVARGLADSDRPDDRAAAELVQGVDR